MDDYEPRLGNALASQPIAKCDAPKWPRVSEIMEMPLSVFRAARAGAIVTLGEKIINDPGTTGAGVICAKHPRGRSGK